MHANLRRRWHQFTLRGALVVVALLAIVLGVKTIEANRQRQAFEAIRELGGGAWYDFEDTSPPSAAPGPEWLRSMIGIDYFASIVSVSAPVAPEAIRRSSEHWRRLPKLERLFFVNTSVTSDTDPIILELKRSMSNIKIAVAWSDAHRSR